MCGKYHISTEDENISFREAIAQLMLEHPEITLQTRDVVPSQLAPVYTKAGLAPLRFGRKVDFMSRLLINARSETAHSSRMFAPLLRTSRVLVPAQAIKERSPQTKPHLFAREAGQMLYMAGLAFPGEGLDDFVILTRDSVGRPSEVHPRMPVMFGSDELRQAWLEQDNLAQALLLLEDETRYIDCQQAG